MGKKICYITGAGENWGIDFVPSANDYVIAVDGGLRYLQEANVDADLVIGDFDTLGHCPSHPNVIRLNPQKDDTDMLAAVKEGIGMGFSVFHLYGGTGGRIDHTIANVQLLAFLSQNGRQGFLMDRNCVITAITDCRLVFPETAQGYLSVFSYTEKSEGVTLCGLKYELSKAVLSNTFPIGISNEFRGVESSVSVESGTLLVVFPKDLLHQLSTIFQ